MTKKLHDSMSDSTTNIPMPTIEPLPEEFRPPSPAPGFTKKDLLPSALKNLGELEEKIDVL